MQLNLVARRESMTFLVLLSVASFGWHAKAVAQCDPAAAAQRYPEVIQAMLEWKQQHNIGIATSAAELLIRRFCSAGDNASALYNTPDRDIKAAAGLIISKYLDEALSTGAKTESLQDRMSDQFGLGSSAGLPEPQSLGVLNIIYTKPVDKIQVNGDVLDPYPTLMVAVGQVAISGTLASVKVCQDTLTVTSVSASSFKCQ